MSTQKTLAPDLLFGIQMLGTLLFVVAQTQRMMHTVQGISPAWLLCSCAFSGINLSLSYRGWIQTRARTTFQLLVTHASWTLGLLLLLILLFTHTNEIELNWDDPVTLLLVASAGVIVYIVADYYEVSLLHPIARGVLAAVLRTITHVALAYKIHLHGGAGMTAVALGSGHVTTCIRIGQLGFTVRAAGWDHSRYGLAIAETSSELTWIFVTVVWLMGSR